MNNDIKEILDYCKEYVKNNGSIDKITSLTDIYLEKLLDYITNLQTIEQQYSAILSENAELENKIKDLEDTIIDKHECIEAQNDTITNLQEENERLKQSKKETLECLKEFHNYENRFKWCEEDYIDTINMFEKKLQGDDNE